MKTKQQCTRFCHRLTGRTLRILLIRAGFPYHKAPHVYQGVWVFLLLPFLEEASLHELIERHGKDLKKLYGILRTYPGAFERLVTLSSLPLFFERLAACSTLNDTAKSRQRIRVIIDDTQAEKYGHSMEFLSKLSDHCHDAYIMGYNYVFLLAVSGSLVFPLGFILWLPTSHPDYRSKNDIARDEILALQAECDAHETSLEEVERLFDSAYCTQKVVVPALLAGFRVITTPGNTHTFEFEGERLTPKEITEKIKRRKWKPLDADTWYHRVLARHHRYGDVVLIVRRRQLKNQNVIYDVLMCPTRCYTAARIHQGYKTRWAIELQFK